MTCLTSYERIKKIFPNNHRYIEYIRQYTGECLNLHNHVFQMSYIFGLALINLIIPTALHMK